MDSRELTESEAIALRLPAREPVHPFSELVWFDQECDATSESSENERHGRGQAERMDKA
jgi:hypothetical protein